MNEMILTKMLLVILELTRDILPQDTLDTCKVSALRFAIQKNVLIKTQAKVLTEIIALAFVIPNEIGSRENSQGEQNKKSNLCHFHKVARVCLTKKAEPPPTCDVNRDSGTASANGGWLRRLVRHTTS